MTRAARMFDGGPLRFLPIAVREPRRWWLAILVGAALTLSGSLLLSWAATSLAPALDPPAFAMRGPVAFLMLVVFAPITETLIMAAALSVLIRLVSPTVAVVLSAMGWGVAHSLQAAVWGMVVWWPFLIFSTLYLVWRERSVIAALGVVSATHAFQNFLPALKIAGYI